MINLMAFFTKTRIMVYNYGTRKNRIGIQDFIYNLYSNNLCYFPIYDIFSFGHFTNSFPCCSSPYDVRAEDDGQLSEGLQASALIRQGKWGVVSLLRTALI